MRTRSANEPDKKPAMKHLSAFLTTWFATHAFAHEGHGLEGSHGHATDAVGLIVALAAVAAALWFGRGGK